MSRVVEHLADLTAFRDHESLDLALVEALNDLLGPDEVALHRVIGDSGYGAGVGKGGKAGDGGWLVCARMRRGETVAQAEAMPDDWRLLPPLASVPERLACLRHQEAVEVLGSPARVWFPAIDELHTSCVLEIVSAEPLDADALRLLISILRVYRNHHSLLDHSERDTLTGLLNRKTFEDRFMRVVTARPKAAGAATASAELRRQTPAGSLWLAVIDIDHFKRVNDVFGHLIGDEVLLLLSRLMRNCFRFHDRLYRFGGEEFVVLMRCDGLEAAATALERLRAQVAAHRFPQVAQITVSVGFTELRADDTPSAAFDRADQALYFVKQHGRNGVANHARLVTSGHLKDRAHASQVELF